ncbi:IS5 family transposase [Neochlamydia sp. AcF65]|uniref:IS5 family transposase n=1 Tax=Neochlamydia sp. AcF65 TaxID=2795735 RepID=UPI00201684C7|nr:IS5 family transposase [Neochlamydia sp. AcF65]
MEKYEKLKVLSAEQFRRLTGVKRETFERMVEVLIEAQNRRYRRAGRRGGLSIQDKLLMALEYLREYRTYFHLGRSYRLSESGCYRACRWVKDTLIKSGEFSLPGKKALLEKDSEYEGVLIDASESPVERPKRRVKEKKKIRNRNNKQQHFYSGKKKRHTLKSQVVVDKKSRKVICTAFSNGKKHDYKLFKEIKVRWTDNRCAITDSEYTGIKKLRRNSRLSKKSRKRKALTQEEKKQNQAISSERVINENVIGSLKKFKIISDRYRNRRRRFGLRFNLIAMIYNYEIEI